MYLNKALIGGNLTRDPEKRALPNGSAVTNFSLATTRVWKGADGQQQEATDFHNIVVFGRPAETSAMYLKKGQFAMVEGRIQTRSWDADDGSKKYRTEIIAERVQFGPKTGGATAPAAAEKDAPTTPDNAGDAAIEYPESDINPEDIPF